MAELTQQKKQKAQKQANSTLTQQKSALHLQDNRQQLVNPIQRAKANSTGLPDKLKAGMENLSGMSLDHVKVHYNSPKPSTVQAHAYAQGSDIHLASGQEKHLPHELGHVVQQAQGKVQATTSVAGVEVNDNSALESEATQMGEQALQRASIGNSQKLFQRKVISEVVQCNPDKDVGLVPPTSHGRNAKYQAPTDEDAHKVSGHKHQIKAKDMTRSERMINRIGRIMNQEKNVHVAVALDDRAIVISANKEDDKKLRNVAALLRQITDDVVASDPLGDSSNAIRHHNVPQNKRQRDMKKVSRLLKGEYTGDDGIELNSSIKAELLKIKTAIQAGVIGQVAYQAGHAGIYVVPTPDSSGQLEHNQHGELKVTKAIKARRDLHNIDQGDVFVGGAWLDCFDCNVSHKMMNEQLAEEGKHWKFYTGGTHGGAFVGYRPSRVVSSKPDRFKELSGFDIEEPQSQIPKVNNEVVPPSGQLPYDSDSDTEDDYETLKFERKKHRKNLLRDTGLADSAKRLKDLHKQHSLEKEESQKRVDKVKKEISKKTKDKESQELGKLELKAHIKREQDNLSKARERLQNLQSEHDERVQQLLSDKKAALESKLNANRSDNRQVKWLDGKWQPVGWKVLGRSKMLLEDSLYAPGNILNFAEERMKEEKLRLEKAIRELPAYISKLETQLQQVTVNIETLSEQIPELEKQLELSLQQHREFSQVKDDEFGVAESDFQGTHGFSYKEVSRSSIDIESAKAKLDNFQF